MDEAQSPIRIGGKVEILTICLLIMAPVLTAIAWAMAVALMWISDFWKLSDKLLATIVPPGFLIAGFVVLTGLGAGGPPQDWIRIPMIFSMAIPPTLVGLYLAVRYAVINAEQSQNEATPMPG